MALDLKEYVRESLITYLAVIKGQTYSQTEVDNMLIPINTALNNRYTKTEVDTLFDNLKAIDITMTGYTIAGAYSAITETDTISSAIAKLEAGISNATTGVQSDWNEADSNEVSFIQNKPDLTLKADLVGGKVPTNQLPASVASGMNYQGTWDASAGTPPSTAPDAGHYYIVSVSGNTDVSGITDWVVSDWAVYNGVSWDKIDNSEATVVVSGDSIVAPFTAITSAEAQTDMDNA